VLEAMVAGDSGTAIVASAVGGVPEVVRDGEEAVLAADGDPAGHLRGIESLLDSAELRGRLGSAAWRRATVAFAPRAVASRSLELYRRVAAGAGR
jgi:starch synthase